MTMESPKNNQEDIWGEKKKEEQPSGGEILDAAMKEVTDKRDKEKKAAETAKMWEGVEEGIVRKEVDKIFATEEEKLKSKKEEEERKKAATSMDWEKMAEETKKKEAEEKKGYFE